VKKTSVRQATERRCPCARHGASLSDPELNHSGASMRLEGRSGDCERSSEKRDIKRITSAQRACGMYDRLHSARQTGATPRVTSPQPPSCR
jgi:hypothetical protein